MDMKWDYRKGQLLNIATEAEKECESRLASMLSIEPNARDFSNTVEAFESIMHDYYDRISPLTFLMNVATEEWMRKESERCEAMVNRFLVDVNSRREIYQALKDAASKRQELSPAKRRLMDVMIRDFQREGFDLPEKEFAELKKMKQRLADLGTKFEANINANDDFILASEKDLAGMSEAFKERLKKKGGKYVIPMKATFYKELQENAKNPSVRRRAYFKYQNREAGRNMKLLKEALRLRHKKAEMLGYKNHVDYATEFEMAKNGKNVKAFLDKMIRLLKSKYKEEMRILSKMKKEETGSPRLEPWDVQYYQEQLKKKEYHVNGDEVKEYFPLQTVVDGMFDIYSKVLGVEFREVKNARVWAPEVKLFEVIEDGEVISYFYMDLFPRKGKYSHACAATILSGRDIGGSYRKPVSSIIANFTAPTKTKPALLSHNEVDTLFHEFGHIVHQVLTKVPYGSLSGSHTNGDFVEAISQMFENWCWEDTLQSLSGHYKTGEKIPMGLVKRLVDARNSDSGFVHMRQFYLSLSDHEMHKTGAADPAVVMHLACKKVLGLDNYNVKMPANWGHLLRGYDAIYYGYMWSKVYAQDMFTVFEKNGIMNPNVGMRFRRLILERGYLVEADVMLREFLHREPDETAFLRFIGAA